MIYNNYYKINLGNVGYRPNSPTTKLITIFIYLNEYFPQFYIWDDNKLIAEVKVCQILFQILFLDIILDQAFVHTFAHININYNYRFKH